MHEYYFLASLLPPLEIGHVPALGFPELKKLMDDNLSAADKKKVEHFLRLIDIENFRAFWAGEALDPRGTIPAGQMEHVLADMEWPSGEPFADYLCDYLDNFRSNAERLEHFPLLLSEFFADAVEHEDGFIRDYFAFQRDMRLVLTGFRAKKLGKDINHELQYEDVGDPIVAQILGQKDVKEYEPPFEYKELRPIFEAFSDSPLDLYKAIYEYQFNQLVELWGGDLFSINRILNYAARLILVERWLELNMQEGIQVIDAIERKIPS